MLEAREVPQLVRGDGGRQGDEIGTGGRGLAGLAQQVVDVDRGRVGGRDLEAAAVSVVEPAMSRSRQSIEVDEPPSRPVSAGSLKKIVVYGPDDGGVWVNV